ncbi:MAG: hypothetical protein JO250_15485 [Armatimonadetes bacterium]|nr:hypothetical protein [Armatimonadota bacterium]
MIPRRFPKALAGLPLLGLLLASTLPAHARPIRRQRSARPHRPANPPAAATPASSDATPGSTLNEVLVGGTLIHRVRTSWAGHSPRQRADQMQQRLNAALAQGPMHPKDFTVGRVQGDWCVLFRGQRLVTADPLTAAQDHTSPRVLASRWATRLRRVLPELTRTKGK